MKRVAPFVHGDVLDIGCGSADVYLAFADRMDSYTGIEREPDRVERLRGQHPGATFHARDVEKDRLDLPGRFDCVLMIALIEHIFNQGFPMESILDVLRPGGHVVLTTPSPFGNDWVHRAGAKVGLFHRGAVEDHIVIYNKHRLGVLAREFGMRLHTYRRFQLGCNPVAVLEWPREAGDRLTD